MGSGFCSNCGRTKGDPNRPRCAACVDPPYDAPGNRVKDTSTTPLAQRLRDAADMIEELMCATGYAARRAKYAAVSADYLRREADVLEAKYAAVSADYLGREADVLEEPDHAS